MTLWLWYVRVQVLRRPRRFVLTCLGLAASFAAVFFAYGVSGWADAQSSRALAAVAGDANVWVVAGQMPELDPATGTVQPRAALPAQTVDALLALGGQAALQRGAAVRVKLGDKPAVLYADEREHGAGLAVASDLWRAFGGHPTNASIGARTVFVASERASLPAGVAVAPFEVGESLESPLPTAWLTSRQPRPREWCRRAGELPGLAVRDALGDVPGARGVALLLDGSLSRFDPFSFRTKFSALTLEASMGTVFGLAARAVFLLGVGLAVSSAVMSLWERGPELAVFAVNGLQSSVTVLLLLEALLVNGLATVAGGVIAAVLLGACLPSLAEPAILGHALGIGIAYVVVLVVITTLVPAQLVAARHPGRLVRRNV